MPAKNFPETINVMKNIGKSFTDKLIAQMRIEKFKATGKTINSIRHKVLVTGDVVRIQLYSDGTKDGGDYSVVDMLDTGFKPRPMPNVSEIKNWMEAKNIKPKDSSGRFLTPSPLNMWRSAFLIARSIGNKGAIRRYNHGGSGILGFVWNMIDNSATNMIADAYETDLTNLLDIGVGKDNLRAK